jgi:hypothetical protein
MRRVSVVYYDLRVSVMLGGCSLFSLWDTVHLGYGVQAVLIIERTVKRKNKNKRGSLWS